MAFDIKICGLKTPETANAAITGGATHCGFIFFAKSPRHLEVAEAAALRQSIGSRAQTVAVTVDAEDAYLDGIVSSVHPDMLQLHGGESPERVMDLKQRHGLPVMKVFSVREARDLQAIPRYLGVADRILLDAKAPKGSDVPGGHGKTFDWSVLETLDPDIEYMLSGGLNAANIAEALAKTKPSGIDISSGVESSPGVKDTGLIEAFFKALNAARLQKA